MPPGLSGRGGQALLLGVMHNPPIKCPRFTHTGEWYVVQKSYTAVEEDELTLTEGDTIEVIHKLLDGWWVVR